MNVLEHLSSTQREKLLLAPVYIALLATANRGELDEEEKKSIAKLAHIKTFCSPEGLSTYYQDVEKEFDLHYQRLDQALPQAPAERKAILEREVAEVNAVISTLDPDMGVRLRSSLDDFGVHAAKVHKTVVEDFIFPIDIKGLTS